MDNLELSFNNTGLGEEADVKKMNFFQRIFGVVVSPEETMKNIALKPKIFLPIVMIAVFSFLAILLNFGLFKDELITTLSKTNSTMTSSQLSTAANIAAIATLVGAPFIALVIWLMGSAVLFGLIKAFKGEGKFLQFLSVTGYAYIILVFSAIISAFVIHATGNYTKATNPTSLATLLPASLSGNFIYGISKGIELFTLWNYFVVGIGISIVSKLSKQKVFTAIGIILVVYLLYLGVSELSVNLVK